ncbi:MAG: M23 family metallopeptidase [Oscillatoriaceae cyanobacterium Prado104]|nr:M23 family metallopeptidase [Oscillatoriaceae cyanobacterium Prado104]
MACQRLFSVVSALIWSLAPVAIAAPDPATTPKNLPTDTPLETPDPARDCPPPAMSRLRSHMALQGETVESIARQYNVTPATLRAMNPSLRSGRVSPGSRIVIPPYDGRLVEVPAGWTWQKMAEAYNVRADLLFEANGCRPIGQVAFVPSVNWAPPAPVDLEDTSVQGFPLQAPAPEILRYGWQTHPVTRQVFFHSGIDFLAVEGTEVVAAGGGTVAFAGVQGVYGNLVVVNHQAGKQTRYAHLKDIAVKTGQKVRSGERLGTVGTTGKPDVPQSHLHFEVRYNTGLGWVAEDPKTYLQANVK